MRITGFGAKSGVVRSFGINSEAAMLAAADMINKQGGVKLADGSKAKMVVDFLDDRCTAEEGISVLRRIYGTDALVAVGPTCSNVAEPLFGILQKKVGDAGDSGLQMPVFTDVAIKVGLAKISEWAFRNVPNETIMYNSLFYWLKTKYPNAQDRVRRRGGGFRAFARLVVRGDEGPRRDQRLQGARQLEVAAERHQLRHPGARDEGRQRRHRRDRGASFTTCGVLKEMQRQGVKPKVLVGLTSSSSLETLQGCAKQAEA